MDGLSVETDSGEVSHFISVLDTDIFIHNPVTEEGFAVTYYFLKSSCWHKTQTHYGFLRLVPFSEKATSLESSVTKIVYLPPQMKAVNATKPSSAWAAAYTPQVFKREAGGQGAAVLKAASAEIFMYPQFHNCASSQCPFSKWSDLHVRSSSDFLGSELLGTEELLEWCTSIFLRNISDEVSKVDFEPCYGDPNNTHLPK